jgi:hypothetical protein
MTWDPAYRHPGPATASLTRPEPANLADVLERVLDKGIIIAGDIRVDLVDVELLTIRIRLLVASVDRAREMGIDWWRHDPMLSSRAAQRERAGRQEELDRQEVIEHRDGPDREPAPAETSGGREEPAPASGARAEQGAEADGHRPDGRRPAEGADG